MAWHKQKGQLFYGVLFVILYLNYLSVAEENKEKKSKKASEQWKNKDIRDYNDADLERLFDQWEDNDEDELEEDELPEWKREPPKVDMSQLDPQNPEAMLQMSKKGRTLMMFATVSGNPTQKEADTISGIWHTSLFNAHYDSQRYMVSENRVIFMLKDGSQAWDIKDYLVKQDRCEEVTIEGKSYPGKGARKKDDPEENKSNKKQEKSETKKSSETDKNKTKKKKEEL